MRWIFLLAFPLSVAACSGGPQTWGITGPGGRPGPSAPASPEDARGTNAVPGVSTTGTFYGPNNGPVTNSSGFYGYN